MSSNTERGYGARIGNAEKLVRALESFNNYQTTKPELSIPGMNEQIALIKNLNTQVASTKQTYSLAIESRLKIFDKNPDSIKKILSPINANVKAVYGKNDKKAIEVARIIEKMRGNNIVKSNNPEANTISQSYQSYHSKIQFFADLVVNIAAFGTDYNPVNPKLSLNSLKEIYNEAVAANNHIVESYTKFALINEERINSYDVLSQNAVRTKENVKAQYGQQSVEYKLIKGLLI